MSAIPPLTIGLPVYNGENYLALALDDLLAQDYGDFRLVISDNASEDGTEEICRAYASRDPRIDYVRHEANRGGIWNYNHAFQLNESPYFKWATHDDGHAPSHLSRCMEAFAEAPKDVVLVYPRVMLVGPSGEALREYDEGLDLREGSAAGRLAHLVRRIRMVNSLLGVIRADVLAATRLNQGVTGYDNLLLAELALRGEFRELPERLFFRRVHPAAASQNRSQASKLAWLSGGRAGKARFPITRRVFAHLEAIGRAPIGPLEKLEAVCRYLPAHAEARVRHRRHQLTKQLRGRARAAFGALRRVA